MLTVSETGFGKRIESYEYRVTGRGGSGIVAIGMGKKNTPSSRPSRSRKPMI